MKYRSFVLELATKSSKDVPDIQFDLVSGISRPSSQILYELLV